MRWINRLKNEGVINQIRKVRKIHTDDKPQQVGGYVTEYDKMKFIQVIGSGHMVPQDKPEIAYKILENLINDREL